MLNLVSTSDVLRVVTSSVATLDVRASYVDYTGSVPSPGRRSTEISSATTTTVVPAPGAGVRRTVTELTVRNTHGATSDVVDVEHFDGSTAVVVSPPSLTLAAGESLRYRPGHGWIHLDATGAER